jgi:ABC-2 type transport system ATP-binding protein
MQMHQKLFKTINPSLAVEACGLVKHFGDNRAVDGIDLKIPTGTIYGVLGPNGAGKTTTIRILATLMKQDRGHARIFGYDIEKEGHIVRQLIGLTGQYASVDEKLSANENLYIFSRLQGFSRHDARKKTAALLEEFGLAEAAKRPLARFSGGMRRRLDLAASLISKPPLIFLDEPTTGLDPRTRIQMWNTIRGLVSDGSTVVLTTQYLDEADQLADFIAVIDRGKVIAHGTPSELKASVGAATLELKLSNKADDKKAKQVIQSLLLVEGHVSEEGVLTAPLSDPEMITDVLLVLRNNGILLAKVSVKTPTLDEVFLSITGQTSKNEAKNHQPVLIQNN